MAQRTERTAGGLIVALALALAVLSTGFLLATETNPKVDPTEPSTGQRAGPSPSELRRQEPARKVPQLGGSGAEARRQALALVDWAAVATPEEDDLVRRTVESGGDNPLIAEALCEHALEQRETDHSRALVTLALLGEMRSRHAADCLERVVSLPLPVEGTVVEGEILERTALEILQAKAIDGLAFLGDAGTDERVLKTVADHPSRIVRAEAIAAYLWNHESSDEARRELRKFIRPGEEIFLDRVVRVAGERAESFNPKLEAFLKAHPELIPPPPERRERAEDRALPAPPDFEHPREERE